MNKNHGILVIIPSSEGMSIFQYARLFKSINPNTDYLPFDFHGSGEFIGSEYNAVGFISVNLIKDMNYLSDIDKYLNEICNDYKSFKNLNELYLGEQVRIKILHHDRLIKLPNSIFNKIKGD